MPVQGEGQVIWKNQQIWVLGTYADADEGEFKEYVLQWSGLCSLYATPMVDTYRTTRISKGIFDTNH